MADRRIHVSKTQEDFLDSLWAEGKGEKGFFPTLADILVLAATLGAKHNLRRKLEGTVKEPIRMDIFERRGYTLVFDLLAIHADKDPLVLADNDEMQDKRATIFEEFANGGLGFLRAELTNEPDPLKKLILILGKEKELPATSVMSDFEDLI